MAQKIVIKQTKRKRAPKRTKAKEVSAVGQALRMLGGLGGRFLGGTIGQGEAGAGVGTGLGATLSRWLGAGDYTVSENSLVRQAASSGVPSMHKNDQVIVVRHKEFITEVTGKIAFTVQRRFSINPGVGTTFPWLSGIAAQYSEYRIRGMVYHYVPSSGDAVSSSNPALGTVMLQTSYRANEAQASTKMELLNEYWSSEGKPSVAFCHPIECDPKENPFNVQYIRTGEVPSTDNILLYDLGTTSLAVSGQQADDVVLGDLWCTYEIELRKPKLTDLTGESLPGFMAYGSANINSTTPLGTDMAEVVDTMVGGASITSNVITLAKGNVGTFQVTMFYTGVTAATFTTMAIVGGTAFSMYGATATRAVTVTTGTGTAVIYTFQQTNPNVITTLTPSFSVLTNATGVYVSIIKTNPAVIKA